MSEDKIVFEPLQAADEAMSKDIPDLEGASL